MNWLTALKYLGLVISIVKQLQEAMPESAGKDKLDVALKLMASIDAATQQILPELTALIGAVKAIFYPKPQA